MFGLRWNLRCRLAVAFWSKFRSLAQVSGRFLAIPLLLGLGLNACTLAANAGRNSAEVTLENPSPLPSPSITQSVTPTPTATATPTPGKTAAPSNTPQPTATWTPTITSTATPLACWTQAGRIELGSLDTELLRLPLDYRVYLPPCYDQQPERRYPALYLIHGQNYNDDQWDRLGADETADRLVSTGELSPFLIIMPRDRYGGQPSENNFARVVADEKRRC